MPNRSRLRTAVAIIILGNVVIPNRLIAQSNSGVVCTCPDCPHVDRTYRQGRWFVFETANFQVCCDESYSVSEHLARHAEKLRNDLQVKWLGNVSSEAWNPQCQLVLHANQHSYVAAVGRGGERTVGSSLVNVDKGQITKRRIDLLGGPTEYLSAALPHELTHVVLKDRFSTKMLPRWADEGMAILADTEAKQERHYKDLQQAIAHRTTFHTAELLAMEEYPSPSRFGAFYGQSASLTEFLVARKSPEKFVQFIDRARENGFDSALQECYEIAGVGELDRQWRQHGYSVQPASYNKVVQSTTQTFQARRNTVSLANVSVSNRPSGE